MTEANVIKQHMEVIGSDGGRDRIELTKAASGDGQDHYIATAIVQDIKGNTVTLTANADTAVASEK